MDKLVSAG